MANEEHVARLKKGMDVSVITLSDVLLVGLFDGLPTSASRTL